MTALVIVDTETSGLDPQTDHLVEVGAVLFDADLGVPLHAEGMLVAAPSNAAEPINRIPTAALAHPSCRSVDDAMTMLYRLADSARGARYFVAHNAAFDRQWLGAIGRNGSWICTLEDASWPRAPGETGSLTAIALAYDVGIVRAHRAIEDCLTLAAVLTRVHELEGGLDAWLARALEPKREVVALVGFSEKDAAKRCGFRWDADRRLWTKRVRASQLNSYCAALPFRTRVAA